jgi:hypothetical protein
LEKQKDMSEPKHIPDWHERRAATNYSDNKSVHDCMTDEISDLRAEIARLHADFHPELLLGCGWTWDNGRPVAMSSTEFEPAPVREAVGEAPEDEVREVCFDDFSTSTERSAVTLR